MPVVFATDHIHPDAARRLGEVARFAVVAWREGPDYADALAGADVVIVRNRLPAELFARAPRLRAVIRHGAGLDMIPLAEAAAHGVLVANVPAVNAAAVAEFAIGQMLALARGLAATEAQLRTVSWEAGRVRAAAGGQLGGATVAIVGMGAVGRRLAAICAQGFGMRVLGVHPARTGGADASCTYVALEQALAATDFLVLACPLNAATHHLIGAAQLALMKPGAFLVNVARGAVVESAALARALAEGRIAGAALDVFETTPLPAGDPLFDLPSARLTPHVAGISAQSLLAMSMGAAEQAIEVLAGRYPAHWVNREAHHAIQSRWAALPADPLRGPGG